MPTKKPTELKSVSLAQIKDLESATVVGGADASAQGGKREAKAAKDDIKLAKDRDKGTGADGSPETSAKDKSDGAKTAKDMKKVAGDAMS